MVLIVIERKKRMPINKAGVNGYGYVNSYACIGFIRGYVVSRAVG